MALETSRTRFPPSPQHTVMLAYLELGVVVHPPQGSRRHAGSTAAIAGLQGLLHKGNGLEVILLPVPEQVGGWKGVSTEGPGSTDGG
jgi:hypothetical protein